ncbi:methyl-accepting chemotaxis protein [Brevibacillus borstelensis]|uniref:methyl-accepting chemotaxis protein n=1 Tax=Brevibacillus borstelensis TaxID=45462 RepID=UPI0030BFE9A3
MFRFKSIRTRTLTIMLPVIIGTLALVMGVSAFTAHSLLTEEIGEKMRQELGMVSARIESQLESHGKVTEALAKTVEISPSSYKLQDLHALLKKTVPLHETSFGMGIFMEPYRYDPAIQYFSTYGQRSQNSVSMTEEYNDPGYGYTNQEWYKNGAAADKSFVFSRPYYDEKMKAALITVTAPFHDENGKLMGVATDDLELGSIQKMISGIKVGETGWAFLIDSGGTYLSFPDSSKLLKANIAADENASLAAIGRTLLDDPQGKTAFSDQNGKNTVYFQEIPQTDWTLALVMPDSELLSPVRSLLWKLSLTSVAGILVLVLVIHFFSRYLARQLDKTNRLSQSLASGDFTATIQLDTADELGQMANRFNEMTATLRETLQRVSFHSEQVAATSEQLTASAQQTSQATEQIAEAVQDIAYGADKQAEATSRGTEIVTQIASHISQIGEAVKTVTGSTSTVRDQAAEGNQMASKAVEQMHLIEGQMARTSDVVNVLGQRSQEIGQMIALITDIAAQTNLLALNAAIEAARAGEQGRGFAVVADEVRKLAEQTAASADQVHRIVTDIQSDTTAVIAAMENGSHVLQEGMTYVRTTGQAFEQISQSTRVLFGQTDEVSSYMAEIGKQMETMIEAIQEISRISEQSSGNTQTVAAAAEEQNASMQEISAASAMLARMATELYDSIRSFKL